MGKKHLNPSILFNPCNLFCVILYFATRTEFIIGFEINSRHVVS